MKKFTCNNGLCGAQFDEPATVFDRPQGELCCPKCGSTDFDAKPRCIVCKETDEDVNFLAYTNVCPKCGEAVRQKASDILKTGLTSDEYEAFEGLYDIDLTEKNVY